MRSCALVRSVLTMERIWKYLAIFQPTDDSVPDGRSALQKTFYQLRDNVKRVKIPIAIRVFTIRQRLPCACVAVDNAEYVAGQ